MADIKKVNGYDLKDEFARQEIENLREDFENNENVDLSQYATIEYVDGVLDNFDSNIVAGDVIDAIEDNYFISLNQFLPAGEISDYAPYINNAIEYCMTNDCSLFIPDGVYTCNSKIIINPPDFYTGFTLKGQSKYTHLKFTNFEGPLFHVAVDAHRVIVEDLYIEGVSNEANQIAIMWEGAQGVLNNIGIYNCGTGIYFESQCWSTNAYALNMHYVHKGIIFGPGAGGCYIELTNIQGDVDYDNVQPNGSVAITCMAGSHMNLLGDGGNMACFDYVYDLTDCTDHCALAVGRVYIEHCCTIYTPTTHTVIYSPAMHVASSAMDKIANGAARLYEVTCNGVNKSTIYNAGRDSAIPVFDLLAYFNFKRGSDCFKDLSDNEAVMNNTESLTIVADDKNLFGRSSRLRCSTNGSAVDLDIPNLGNKFTIVMSFRQASHVQGSQMRYFELSNRDTTDYDFRLMFVSGGGNTLLGTDNKNSVAYPNMSVLSETPYTEDPYPGDNVCVAFAFDLDEGTITPFSPYYGVFDPIENEQLKGFANGNMNFDMFKSWNAEVQPFVMNYLAVFDGVLGYDQLLNIYRKTTPLIR